MGRPMGSCCDQKKFPEFVERDGKKYQILIKFSHRIGKPRRYLKHLANIGGEIDSIFVDYGSCKRVYICIDELERMKQTNGRTSYRAKEFVEEGGRVCQMINRYCADNCIGLDAVRFRLRKRSKNPKYHLEGKRIKTPYESLWYVFVELKKGETRTKYVAQRWGELKSGKIKNRKDLDGISEDFEEVN